MPLCHPFEATDLECRYCSSVYNYETVWAYSFPCGHLSCRACVQRLQKPGCPFNCRLPLGILPWGTAWDTNQHLIHRIYVSFRDVEFQAKTMTAEIASKEKVIQDLKKQLAVKEKIIQDKERQLDIEEHDSRDLKKQLDSQEKMARDLTDQLNASKESEERCKWALKKERERAFQAQIDSVLLSKLRKLFREQDTARSAEHATRAASTSWRSRGVQVNSQRSPNQDNAVPTQINFSTQTGANADSASQIEEVPTLNSSTSTIAQAVFGLSNRMDQMAVTSAGSAAAQIPVSLLETQTAQIPDPVPRIPPVGEACLPEASVLPQQAHQTINSDRSMATQGLPSSEFTFRLPLPQRTGSAPSSHPLALWPDSSTRNSGPSTLSDQ